MMNTRIGRFAPNAFFHLSPLLMKNWSIKFALYLNYFVFAILLNSVGIVILKAQKNYLVDEVQASTLELFKDMPIALVSFAIASFLPRIGYKKAMLIGLSLVVFACLGMFIGNSFLTAKLLFAGVGIAFALIKVSVYSSIGLLTTSPKEHNSLMSSIEGFFMVGIAVAYFLFPAFNSADPNGWLRVYILLAALAAASFFFLWFTPFSENHDIDTEQSIWEDMNQMKILLGKLLVLVFVASSFLFVMVEQGIMTWLPTFNNRILQLNEDLGIMMASILAISLAAGRLIAGFLTKFISWFWIITVCIGIAMSMVLFLLPQTLQLTVGEVNTLADIPFIGYTFPLIGLFIAPIYPLLNSVVLSATPKKLHSPMTGLIVIFSALGGTLGSRIIGWLFKTQGGENAFYFTLIPMALLLVALVLLQKLTKKPF
ncbi:MAG: MFS transporter [Spirosomataceae bacterium]